EDPNRCGGDCRRESSVGALAPRLDNRDGSSRGTSGAALGSFAGAAHESARRHDDARACTHAASGYRRDYEPGASTRARNPHLRSRPDYRRTLDLITGEKIMKNPTTYRTVYQKCCTELKCESGLRNNYFEGKRLTVDSFRVEQNYLLERRR